ncbi:outer membrane receptor protein involved in Fe transport [Parabacteroides sp. PFB2-10]|uniref:TonB-dependent receptor n=1 Tax=Parabacteroides sp. PFB2-10 TaxID=1742405 RepID=UPI00247379A5|nr:TonB-dependent receptor [Parabacteroides sp. PFB2-10]MDH6313789.1 outer membrane receptor protein involved in Fe transport [Parabacteroides sp. PFB2-10]
MKKAIYIPILLFFFFFSTVYAQERVTLSGKVTSTEEEVLSYGTVLLKGTSYGGTTDIDGAYSFQAPAGEYTLVASFLGYETFEKRVKLVAGKNETWDIVIAPKAAELGEVVVVSSNIKRVRESAFNVLALDVKELRNSAAEIKDVLAKAPGIKVRESGGVGSDVNFSLDGFSGRHVQFFLDGVPLDTRNSSFNISNIPVNFAERIEIYKGVVPVEFGADALGGVVNIVTGGNRERTLVDASYSYGSFNTHKTSALVNHTTKQGVTMELNVYQNYSDNNYYVYTPVEDLENGQINNSKVEKVRRFHDTYHNEAVIAKVGLVGKSFADRLLLGINLSQSDKEIQNGVRQEIVFGQRRRKAKSFMPSLEYRKRNLFTKGLNASLTANYNYSQTYLLDTATYKYNWRGESVYNGGKLGEQSYQNTKNDNRNWNVTANLNYRIGEAHKIVLNHVLTAFDRKNNSRSETQTQNGIANRSRKNITGLSYQYNHSNLWNVSLLGKYYNQYNSGPQNSSSDPTRFDYVKSSQSTDAFGYGAVASYFLLKDIQLKLSYEKTLRLPTNSELFGDEDLEVGKLELKPERSDNVNFNLNYEYTIAKHNVYLEGGLIYRNTTDYIRRVTNRYSGGLYYGAYENHGNVVTKGASAELRYNYANRLSLGGNLTYQDIRNNERYINGYEGRESSTYKQRMPNTPYFFFNADATVYFRDLIKKGNLLTINYFNTYVHEFSLYWENEGSSSSKLKVPKQFSHNVNISYSMKNGRYNISLECRNLTDERLYDNFSLQKAGRAFYGKIRYTFNK